MGIPIFIMPAISLVQQQTVYILLLFDGAIFLYLKFHPETYLSFPKKAAQGATLRRAHRPRLLSRPTAAGPCDQTGSHFA